MIFLQLLKWNREETKKENCTLYCSLKAFSLVVVTSLWPQQAGILRLKYGGIQGGREGVPAFEPLSDPYSLLLSAWEHKFLDADGPARTKPNLSAPKYWWSPWAEGVWKTQLLFSSPGDGDSECSFLVSWASPRQDHTLQGTLEQAFRLVPTVRAEKEALGRETPSGVLTMPILEAQIR